MIDKKQYNTRVAPSPTGHFHLGTARVAYHNWLASKSTGGKFILRIDDTDNQRNDKAYVDLIYSSLDWLGIDYDSTFTQSSRLSHHKDVAQLLIDKKLAVMDGTAIRLNSNYILDSWTDLAAKNVKVAQQDIDFCQNMILFKSNGSPLYNFATVVDDIDTNINLIIRGADHISNTVKQLFISKALVDAGYTNDYNPMYCHVGLIMVKNKDNKLVKLSKRDSASSLNYYKDNNYTADSVLNSVLRLGWSHTDPNFDKYNPLINKDLAIDQLWNGKFKTTNCAFDMDKLIFLDKKYKNL